MADVAHDKSLSPANGQRGRQQSHSRSRSYSRSRTPVDIKRNIKHHSRSYSRSRSKSPANSRSKSPVHLKRRSRSRSGSFRRNDRRRPAKRISRSHSKSKSHTRSPTGGGYRRNRSRTQSRSKSPRGSRRAPLNNPAPSRCLGVFGLSLRTKESDLYKVFSKYGDIDDITLIYDNYTGRSRGFAFVYYRSTEDAKDGKNDAHGMELDGRPIRVDYSLTERPHTPTPGIYMGRPSYGGRRRSPPKRRRYSRSRSHSRSRSRSNSRSRSRSDSYRKYRR